MSDVKRERKRSIHISENGSPPSEGKLGLGGTTLSNSSDEALAQNRLEEMDRMRAAGEIPPSQPQPRRDSKRKRRDHFSGSSSPSKYSLRGTILSDPDDEQMVQERLALMYERAEAGQMPISQPRRDCKRKRSDHFSGSSSPSKYSLRDTILSDPDDEQMVQERLALMYKRADAGQMLISQPRRDYSDADSGRSPIPQPPHVVGDFDSHDNSEEQTPFPRDEALLSLNGTEIGSSPVCSTVDLPLLIKPTKKPKSSVSRIPRPIINSSNPPHQKLNSGEEAEDHQSGPILPPILEANLSPIQSTGAQLSFEDENEAGPISLNATSTPVHFEPAAEHLTTPVLAYDKLERDEPLTKTAQPQPSISTSEGGRRSQEELDEPIERKRRDSEEDTNESSDDGSENEYPQTTTLLAPSARKSVMLTKEAAQTARRSMSLPSTSLDSNSEVSKSMPPPSRISEAFLSQPPTVEHVTREQSKSSSSQDVNKIPPRPSSDPTSSTSQPHSSKAVDQTTAALKTTFKIPGAPPSATPASSSVDKRKSAKPRSSASSEKTRSVSDNGREFSLVSNNSGTKSKPNSTSSRRFEKPGPKSVKERRLAEKSARLSSGSGGSNFPSVFSAASNEVATEGAASAPNAEQVSHAENNTYPIPPPVSSAQTETSVRRMPKSDAKKLTRSRNASTVSKASTSLVQPDGPPANKVVEQGLDAVASTSRTKNSKTSHIPRSPPGSSRLGKRKSKTSSSTDSVERRRSKRLKKAASPSPLPPVEEPRIDVSSTTATISVSKNSKKSAPKRDTTPVRYTGKDVFGNYHMMKREQIYELINKIQPGHGLEAAEMRKIALKTNHFLEDFFEQLCESTDQPYGFVRFKQLMALLEQQHLIPKNSTPEDLMESMMSSLSKKDWKKNKGILYPLRTSYSMDTDIYALLK